jgi:chromosome partitioning protein
MMIGGERPTMKVLAVYNIKGGVGKTAAAVNLAHLASEAGHSTLLWDLDPQGAASFYFRVRPRVEGGGQKLLKRRELDHHVRSTEFPGLDLLPADFSYRHLDLDLSEYKKPTRRIRKLLAEGAVDYDYVVLDCPPSISLVSESVFGAADALVVPTIPTLLSLRTLGQIVRFFREHGLEHVRLLPFYSMVDSRKTLHRAIVSDSSALECRMLLTCIPYAADVERMGLRRAPLTSYSRSSAAAQAFRDLWEEVQARLEDTPRGATGDSG